MKYTKMYRWLALPLLLLTATGLLLLGQACNPAQVSMSPTSQTVAPGQTFDIEVLVDAKGAAIAGAQFDLSFDPSLLTAISVTEGNLLSQGGCDTFFLPGKIDNVAGTITGFACVIITPGGTVKSSGTLARITFSAGTTAGTSALTLSNVIVGNKAGTKQFVSVAMANVTVSAK
jgi:hypothetical protein